MTTTPGNSTLQNPAELQHRPSRTDSERGRKPRPVAGGSRSLWRTILITSSVITAIGLAYVLAAKSASYLPSIRQAEPPLTAIVKRSSAPIDISAGGELASADAVDVVCELEGQQHKIIEMLPEGAQVAEDDVVIRLDPSAIHDRLAEQQITVTQARAVAKASAEDLKIQQNLGESQVATADLQLQLARLDEEKYLKGDYLVEQNDLQGSIALARAALQDAQAEHEHFKDLVKKGFRTPEQLRSKEQAVKEAEYNLSRDEERLKVLENFTRRRQVTELKAKAEEAAREVERARSSAAAAVAKAETDREVAQATAELEDKQLARIEQQLALCHVRAATDGRVIYAKDKNKTIELGGAVHYKQKLFSLSSTQQMQVDAFVHESVIKKVAPGMKAEVRLDAFPNLVLHGAVREVAGHYDSTRHWLSGGVKEYATTISLDDVPELPLRTGMTAEVRVHVTQLTDSLVVPLSAVAQRDGQYFCFVVAGQTISPQPVQLGANTKDLVEVVDGLSGGEQVALDARRRAGAEWVEGDSKPGPATNTAEDSRRKNQL